MKFLIVIVILIVLIKMQKSYEPFETETSVERSNYENIYFLLFYP